MRRSVDPHTAAVLTPCRCPGEVKRYCCQTLQRFHNGGGPCYLEKEKRNGVYFQCQTFFLLICNGAHCGFSCIQLKLHLTREKWHNKQNKSLFSCYLVNIKPLCAKSWKSVIFTVFTTAEAKNSEQWKHHKAFCVECEVYKVKTVFRATVQKQCDQREYQGFKASEW